MAERVNIKEHCSPLAENLRKTCEFLAGQCIEQSSKGARDLTLPTPDGSVEVTHDLNSCLGSAKSIPLKDGALPNLQSPASEASGGRSRFTLSLGEGYHFFYATFQKPNGDTQIAYQGHVTQLNIGVIVGDDGKGFQAKASGVLGHSDLYTSKEGFDSLQVFETGLQVGAGYIFNRSLGLHFSFGGAVDFFKTDRLQWDDGSYESLNYNVGGNMFLGAGLSFFDDKLSLLARGQYGGCKVSHKFTDRGWTGENMGWLAGPGLMLTLSLDIPEALGFGRERARKRGEEILNSHGL